MGEDAIDDFLLSSSIGQLDSRSRRSAKVQKLTASRSSSELSAHQMAPNGVIAHLRARPALEPMKIFPSVQR